MHCRMQLNHKTKTRLEALTKSGFTKVVSKTQPASGLLLRQTLSNEDTRSHTKPTATETCLPFSSRAPILNPMPQRQHAFRSPGRLSHEEHSFPYEAQPSYATCQIEFALRPQHRIWTHGTSKTLDPVAGSGTREPESCAFQALDRASSNIRHPTHGRQECGEDTARNVS